MGHESVYQPVAKAHEVNLHLEYLFALSLDSKNRKFYGSNQTDIHVVILIISHLQWKN